GISLCLYLFRIMIFIFFFSSRRRHTRFSRDWSSDVCSSDLRDPFGKFLRSCQETGNLGKVTVKVLPSPGSLSTAIVPPCASTNRSEERRVGKECRSRWSPDRSEKEEEQEG